jgi:hypothetical protein
MAMKKGIGGGGDVEYPQREFALPDANLNLRLPEILCKKPEMLHSRCVSMPCVIPHLVDVVMAAVVPAFEFGNTRIRIRVPDSEAELT